MARLAAYHPGDVAMPGGIVGEHDVSWSKTFYRTVAGFNLDLSSERDDVLAPRRVVKIAKMSRRRSTEDNPMRRLERGNFHMADQIKLYVDVFEVRLVVRSRVKPDDLHQRFVRESVGKSKGTVMRET
jgi:hypothetical protein